MNRRVKQLILITPIVIICTAILSWPAVVRYLVQSALQQARRGGQQLAWSGITTGMTSVSLENLTVWVPGPKVKGTLSIPVSIELQGVSLVLHVASLLTLKPTLSYDTSLYGGTIKGEAQHTAHGDNLSAKIDGVEVGKHPQFAALGIRGGAITGSVDQLVITPQGPTNGDFSLALNQLTPSVPSTTKTLLRVDDLGAVDISAAGKISPQSVQVSDIKVSSQFGSASGSLTALNHLSDAPNLGGTFKISLSERGSTIIGPWLPLIPGAGLDATTQSFTVRLNSVPCGNLRGDALVLNIPPGCVKLSFGRG